MQTKNITICSLIVLLMLGLNSCSSDNDTIEVVETVITVSTADFTTTVNENPTNGDVLGIVQGTTNEGSITFSIVEQTPLGAFAINSSSGELTVADESLYDFETNPMIIGIVKVTNGSVFENAAITIELNDVNEENIFYGNVTLISQGEVDLFGANNYTEVTGGLSIFSCLGNPLCNITDLSSLASITSVGEVLFIKNTVLTNLNGLNIESVGRFVRIEDNEQLENIDGLNSLIASPEGIWVWDNDMLTNLDGFSNISNLTGFITIARNNSLENIDGLTSINTTIERIAILNNDSLSNIDALYSIINILDYLSIDNNNTLVNLNGLNGLTNINDHLSIRSNSALSDFCDLQSLLIGGGLGGDYYVSDNAYNPTQQDIIDGNCSL